MTDLLPDLRPLCGVAVVIAAWWILTAMGSINQMFLPKPEVVAKALWMLLSGLPIYVDIFTTLWRALSGLLLSFLVAVPLGLAFGRFMNVYRFVEPVVDFFRSIPSSAIYMLFILFFGFGNSAKVAVVFYGCSLILLVNTVYGAKPTREKQDRINMLRSFGATPIQIFRFAVWRDALPQIIAGLRVCVSLSLVLVVVTEMFLSLDGGLGERIFNTYHSSKTDELYATIIILGVVGHSANKLTLLFERRTAFWTP